MSDSRLTFEQLCEIRDLARRESLQITEAKESIELLIAEVEKTWEILNILQKLFEKEAVMSEQTHFYPIKADATEYNKLASTIVELFNPVDSVTEDELPILEAKLKSVFKYIVEQECECEGEDVDDEDAEVCERCEVLGRFLDEKFPR